MKIARLHTGEELQFPPETDDEHIKAAVRKKLGIALPAVSEAQQPDPTSTAMQDAVALFSNFIRRMDILITRVDESVQASQHMAAVMAQAVQQGQSGDPQATLAALERSNKELINAVNEAKDGIRAALLAPKVVTYDKGRPAGVKVQEG